MAIPTVGISETSPAGGDNIALGDNRIREYKTQVREILEVNHDFPSSGNSLTAGQHKKVTFQEQADLGTGAVSATILGSQTIAGKGELVYTDEDDNDIQLSKAGKLCVSTLTTVASISTIMNLIYPIGSVVTLGVSTNPATLFGIGTWTAIAGKVIVGIDGTQTEFDTLNETGGAKTVTLDATMIPSHSHDLEVMTAESGGTARTWGWSASSRTVGMTSGRIGSTGGGLAHENMPPYICKFCWERTA